MRRHRIDVETTLFRRHVPAAMLPDVTDSQLNPLPASGEFCRLLMIFLKEFFKKVDFEKKKKKKKKKKKR